MSADFSTSNTSDILVSKNFSKLLNFTNISIKKLLPNIETGYCNFFFEDKVFYYIIANSYDIENNIDFLYLCAKHSNYKQFEKIYEIYSGTICIDVISLISECSEICEFCYDYNKRFEDSEVYKKLNFLNGKKENICKTIKLNEIKLEKSKKTIKTKISNLFKRIVSSK